MDVANYEVTTMNTLKEVESLKEQLISQGVEKHLIISELAKACVGWPYVFGAWGEQCTPSGRKRRSSADHPTIVSKCPALNGKSCQDCKWGIGVRMFDCRGFTAWLLRQVGLDLKGEGATSQYNSDNWARKGSIAEMPNVVCCLFKKVGNKMEHTGMHIGDGTVIHCSVNVQTGTTQSGWTHYAVPKGLYDGEIPDSPIKPTLRRGSTGDTVRSLQEKLNSLGYPCGSADGIFGTKTENAVKKFQSDHNLTADGVCGAKTWNALESAEPEQTYRVTIEGVTWKQYMQIRENFPLAEAAKETNRW